MQIWIDADACPKVARELIIKTAIRTQRLAVFVANQSLPLQKSPYLNMQVVGKGFDVADDYIVEQCQAGDLVLTNDIPMASDVLDKFDNKLNNTKINNTKKTKQAIYVMDFKGNLYTAENIKQRLNMRDFMETMRGTGMLDPSDMGGQKPYSDKDKKAFADGLNRLVR